MPHHDDQWDRKWQKFERMARRGFGQIAGRLGDFDAFGENFRIGRMLASGDVRLVALYFIEQQPRHGYDLIKAIEERSGGFYSPSPGIVYPALTFLEEAGYVTSQTDGNKKLYTISDEGRTHLADNRDAIQSTLSFLERAGNKVRDWRDRMQGDWSPGEEREEVRVVHRHHGPGGRRPDRDMRDVVPELNEARRALKAAIADAAALGADEQRRVADILARAAAEIAHDADDDEVDI